MCSSKINDCMDHYVETFSNKFQNLYVYSHRNLMTNFTFVMHLSIPKNLVLHQISEDI